MAKERGGLVVLFFLTTHLITYKKKRYRSIGFVITELVKKTERKEKKLAK